VAARVRPERGGGIPYRADGNKRIRKDPQSLCERQTGDRPMRRPSVTPTGREIMFDPADVIVSKTDLKGRITYCNRIFIAVSGHAERDLLGAPHSIVRHPDMPRCVFKLLWDTIEAGSEIFAYVKNMARSGDHYWVMAHVTPSRDPGGRIVSYHSNRRVPERRAVEAAARLYAELLALEAAADDRKAGMEAAYDHLTRQLAARGLSYDEFALSL
jgi:PAS domain S-box-containing protein